MRPEDSWDSDCFVAYMEVENMTWEVVEDSKDMAGAAVVVERNEQEWHCRQHERLWMGCQ